MIPIRAEADAEEMVRCAISLREPWSLVLHPRRNSTLQASKVQSEFLGSPARQELTLQRDVRLDTSILESDRNLLWLQHDFRSNQQEEEVECRRGSADKEEQKYFAPPSPLHSLLLGPEPSAHALAWHV